MKWIIDNRLHYAGCLVSNKRQAGQYHSAVRGEVISHRLKDEKRNDWNDRSEWTIAENAHPAIIDASLLQQVDAQAARRACGRGRPRNTEKQTFIFSGLLYCAQCGELMHGRTMTKRKTSRNGDEKVYRYKEYVCSVGQRSGCGGESGCRCFSIREDVVLRVVAGRLADALDDFDPDLLRLKLRKAAKAAVANDDLITRRKQVNRLRKKYDTGVAAVLEQEDGDVRRDMNERLAAMKRELTLAANSLSQAEHQSGVGDIDVIVDESISEIDRLREGLDGEDAEELQAVMQAAVAKLSFWWRPRRPGEPGRKQFVADHAVIDWTEQTDLFFRTQSRGDWI